MVRIKLKECLSIPNILCYIRILLIPLFIMTYIQAQTPEAYYLAAFIIFLSGVTDFLDGYIARRFNMITDLGKLIDPLADKLTQAGIAVALVWQFESTWILIIIFVLKELFMGIACVVLLKRRGKKLDGALWFGKMSTAIFYLTTFILIATPNLNIIWADSLILFTSGILLFSFVKYFFVFKTMYNDTDSTIK